MSSPVCPSSPLPPPQRRSPLLSAELLEALSLERKPWVLVHRRVCGHGASDRLRRDEAQGMTPGDRGGEVAQVVLHDD